jgi:hypothetical protein
MDRAEQRTAPTAPIEAERRPANGRKVQDRCGESSPRARKADRQAMLRQLSAIGLAALAAAASGCGGTAAAVHTESPARTVVVTADPSPEDARAFVGGFERQVALSAAASAKVLAGTAMTAAEVYATEHEGAYTNLSIAEVQAIEPTVAACPQRQEACLEVANGSREGFVVTTVASDGSIWSIEVLNGAVNRRCSPPTGQALPYGACINGTW